MDIINVLLNVFGYSGLVKQHEEIRMEKEIAKRIEWMDPVLMKLSEVKRSAFGLCEPGSGDSGDCMQGNNAQGVCNTGNWAGNGCGGGNFALGGM